MKKKYAIVTTSNGRRYAAHIDRFEEYAFEKVEPVSRDEYRAARAGGLPSWGEAVIEAKREDTPLHWL